MENREMKEGLKVLVQAEVDAASTWGKVVEGIGVAELQEAARRIQGDHEFHREKLAAHLRTWGEEPPREPSDTPPFPSESFDTEGALLTLRSLEEERLLLYREALSIDYPGEISALLEAMVEDEFHHRQVIDSALRERPWNHFRRDRWVIGPEDSVRI